MAEASTERVTVYHPEFRKSVSIPKSSLADAEAKGWRIEGPEEEGARYYEEQYGDRPVQTFVEGVGRTLTLGGSDAVASAFGAEEGVRERRERNAPYAVAGEITGALVPGTSTVAGRAGAAVRTAVETRAGTGLLGRTVTRAASTGTEGALFGVGQGLSEVNLTDDPVTVEGAFSTVASHALWGAGGGAALGSTLGLLGDGVAAARNMVRNRIAPAAAPADDFLEQVAAGPTKPSAEYRRGLEAQREALEGEIAARRAPADLKARGAEIEALETEAKGAVAELRDEIAQIGKEAPQAAKRAEKIATGKSVIREYPGPGAGAADDLEAQLRASIEQAKAGKATAPGRKRGAPPSPGGTLPVADEQIVAVSGTADEIARAAKQVRDLRADWERVFKFRRVIDKRGRATGWKSDLTDEELRAAIADFDNYALHTEYRRAILRLNQSLRPNVEFKDIWPKASMKLGDIESRIITARRAASELGAKIETPSLIAMSDRFDELGRALEYTNEARAAQAIHDYVKFAEAGGMKASADEIVAAAKAKGYGDVKPSAGHLDILKAQIYGEQAKKLLSAKAPAREPGMLGGIVRDVGAGAVGYAIGGPIGAVLGPFGARVGGRIMGRVARAIMKRGALRKSVEPANVKMRIVAAVEEATERASRGVDRFLRGRAGRTVAPASAILSRVSFAFDEAKRVTNVREAAKERSLELARMVSDERRMSEWIWNRLEGIRAIDLGLYDQMSTIARATMHFLASKAPKEPTPGLIKRAWHVNDADTDRFARYVAAAVDPIGRLVAELESGAITAETVETVKALAPAQYAKLQAQIVARIPELRETLTYRQRLSLSVLFERPVDESMEPERTAMLQQQFAVAQSMRPDPSKKAIGSVKLKAETQPTRAQKFAAV